MKVFKNLLFGVLKSFFPSIYWNRIINKFKTAAADEPELKLLPVLGNSNKIFLDIGAAGGLYSVNMRAYAKKCIMFEPIPGVASGLRNLIKYAGDKLELHQVAISDHSGKLAFRMVENDLGRSTLEEENKLDVSAGGKLTSIEVSVKKLDEYNFTEIALMKIDVEGHELSVLKGAAETLKRCMPAIIIEIEERHKKNAVQQAREILENLGYKGYFINEGKLYPVENFNIQEHQNVANIGDVTNHYRKKGVYINNFIYIPKSFSGEFLQRASQLI